VTRWEMAHRADPETAAAMGVLVGRRFRVHLFGREVGEGTCVAAVPHPDLPGFVLLTVDSEDDTPDE
jgi:hypothetical protein